MTTHAEISRALQARWPEHRVAPSLARIRALTDLLGEPQTGYPVIQVAGTNGKGSTAIIIEALLLALGLRVGRIAVFRGQTGRLMQTPGKQHRAHAQETGLPAA